MTDQPIFDHPHFDDDDYDETEHRAPPELLREAQRLLAQAAAVAPYVDDFSDCA